MKKILVLLTLLLVLTACGNSKPVVEESDNYSELFEAYETQGAMLETSVALSDAFMDQRNTVVAANATWAYKPTYTPYPTPIPTATLTPTMEYDPCAEKHGIYVVTLEKVRIFTPRWNKDGTALKKLNGKLIVLLVPLKYHTGINAGTPICVFERVQTDKGTMWRFNYYIPDSGLLGNDYGYYVPASKVERLVKE